MQPKRLQSQVQSLSNNQGYVKWDIFNNFVINYRLLRPVFVYLICIKNELRKFSWAGYQTTVRAHLSDNLSLQANRKKFGSRRFDGNSTTNLTYGACLIKLSFSVNCNSKCLGSHICRLMIFFFYLRTLGSLLKFSINSRIYKFFYIGPNSVEKPSMKKLESSFSSGAVVDLRFFANFSSTEFFNMWSA